MFKKEIFENFNVEEKYISAVDHGNGHINDTFLVKTNGKNEIKYYILQKINHKIFKNIDGLMKNIEIVTSHVTLKSPDAPYQKMIKTKNNENYFFCDDTYTYWRLYTFIEDSISLENITDPKQFYETGIAFGEFQKYLLDLKADQLIETIIDFHNTKTRYKNFQTSVENNLVNRVQFAKEEIDFLLSKKHYASVVVDLLKTGEIPIRITHNDTKLNNVLFHQQTGKALSVVDLDTIMPGSILYDFGDAIRYGANKGKEDDENLANIGIDLNLFKLFTQGFLKHTAHIMNEKEIENLAFSALLMTYELSMRFLEDYLNGDTYFKTKEPNHNLRRARAQIALMKDIEKNLDAMKLAVKETYTNCLNNNHKL